MIIIKRVKLFFLLVFLIQGLSSSVLYGEECWKFFSNLEPGSELESESQVDIDYLASKMDSAKTGFEKFKSYRKHTDSSMYVRRTSTIESSNINNYELDLIYPPAKSVVGLEVVMGGPFELEPSSIMERLSSEVIGPEGELYFGEFYQALSVLKSYNPSVFFDILEKIKDFISEDLFKIADNYYIATESKVTLGVLDPMYREIVRMLADNSITQGFLLYITTKIIKEEVRDDYPIKPEVGFYEMNASVIRTLAFLYYKYYYNIPLHSTCSGTVLAHNLLLTAAHSVAKAKELFYYHEGKEYKAIGTEYNVKYTGRHSEKKEPKTLDDAPVATDMGIIVFPDGTFSDIPAASISMRVPEIGEEVVASGMRLVKSMLKVGIGQVSGNKFLLHVTPKPWEFRPIAGESGGGVFDSKDRLIGSITGSYKDHDRHDQVVNMYTLTNTNRDFISEVLSRFSEVKLEE